MPRQQVEGGEEDQANPTPKDKPPELPKAASGDAHYRVTIIIKPSTSAEFGNHAPALHKLGGTEGEGREECGEEARRAVLESAQVLHLAHPRDVGDEFLAHTVEGEENTA